MNWNLVSMLRSMSGLARAVVVVLLLMLVLSVVIVIDRGLRYTAARNQSQNFIRQSAEAFDGGKIDEVISIAQHNKKSHIAQVVATGLADFQRAPALVSDANVIEVA